MNQLPGKALNINIGSSSFLAKELINKLVIKLSYLLGQIYKKGVGKKKYNIFKCDVNNFKT